MAEVKELELELKLRNNLLKRRRLDLGLTTHQLAEQIGIGYGVYIQYESLKLNPLSPRGRWKPSALRISDFYKTLPETLWPEVVLAVKAPTMRMELAAEEALALTRYRYEQMFNLPETPEEALVIAERRTLIDRSLLQLTPRQALVLRARANGATLDEIGEDLEVGRETRKLVSFIDPDFEG